MLHGYTSDRELMDLYIANRKAFVIRGVQTKDIDEYISGVYYTLRDIGFDINKLTQPKIISHKKNNEYTIVFLYRASVKIFNGDKQLISKLEKLIGKRICNLNDYVGRAAKCNDASDIAVKEWIDSKAVCVITFRGNGKSKKLYANVISKDNMALRVEVLSNNTDNIKLTILTNVSYDKLLLDILNKVSSVIFESHKMLADEVQIMSKNKTWTTKFKVEHAMSGMSVIKY